MRRLIDADVLIQDAEDVLTFPMLDRINRQPIVDAISAETYNQAIWERDIAIGQLNSIGKNFGEQMNDVRPVVRGEWIPYLDGEHIMPERYYECSVCASRGSIRDVITSVLTAAQI